MAGEDMIPKSRSEGINAAKDHLRGSEEGD